MTRLLANREAWGFFTECFVPLYRERVGDILTMVTDASGPPTRPDTLDPRST